MLFVRFILNALRLKERKQKLVPEGPVLRTRGYSDDAGDAIADSQRINMTRENDHSAS